MGFDVCNRCNYKLCLFHRRTARENSVSRMYLPLRTSVFPEYKSGLSILSCSTRLVKIKCPWLILFLPSWYTDLATMLTSNVPLKNAFSRRFVTLLRCIKNGFNYRAGKMEEHFSYINSTYNDLLFRASEGCSLRNVIRTGTVTMELCIFILLTTAGYRKFLRE